MRPLALILALSACGLPRSGPPGPTDGPIAAITVDDLRRDLYALASDSMRGREAGTLDELRASVWVAERAREAGLEPAGDDGTFYQFWPMRRVRVAAASWVTVGDTPLALGREAVIVQPVNASVDAPLVFVGEGREADLARTDVKGRAAIALLTAPSTPVATNVSLREFRYARAAIAERAAAIAQRGAAAVLLVSDDTAESAFEFVSTGMTRGRYNIDSTGTGEPSAGPPVIWVRRALLDRVRAAGRLRASVVAESFVYPSVNIVARVRGSDAALRDEYVLFSGHQDHDGVRRPAGAGTRSGLDSIWNGADDNATVSVALLAIGRAFVRQPARRSALFVWHGAEERGLLGSRWFVAHPTVPRSSIVAVLNGDMIGRGAPDSAALLGAQPPHRNSSDLVAAALGANSRVTHFALDTTWDRPTHPEFWYFRSDHLPYARAGVPALFFTTLLHPDYHTPRDEATRIDVAKLAGMARWMYATGFDVANAGERPRVEEGVKLER